MIFFRPTIEIAEIVYSVTVFWDMIPNLLMFSQSVKVGGSLGSVFDEDPRRWRMAAEIVTTVGLGLEISTAFYPKNFLILASTGNLAKALGKGMGKPAFRVLQQHFSRTNNVGEVAAKEEVVELLKQRK